MSGATLDLAGLSVGYRARGPSAAFALGRIDAAVRPGELVCLLGPNGSGKSTLLRTIAGFQPPLAGRVLYEGRASSEYSENARARFVAVVLTEPIDAGMLNARELVSLGRYPYTGWTGRLTPADRRVVEWALDAVGAADLAARSVMSLSDGERQKIMIARALAQQPRLVILDEPTAYLDLPRKVDVMRLLGNLAREKGCAVLLSTHEIEIALTLADRLWLIRSSSREAPGPSLEGPARKADREAAGEKPLLSGAPEDLVLSGDFERLFSADGVPFDPHAGRFLLAGEPRRSAVLVGTGISREWTARALRRAGIRALDPASAPKEGEELPRIVVEERTDGRRWTTILGGTRLAFTSLSELLAALRDGPA